MNKKIIYLIIVLLILFEVGYYVYKRKNVTINNQKAEVVDTITYEKDNIDFSDTEEITIDLNNIDDVYTISKGGVYHFTGTFNSYIKIDTEDNVKIILDNVTVTNENGPCIYGYNSKNIYIELVGKNVLSDGSSYNNIDEEVKSTIFSNDDLIILGEGSLTVNANYNDGISSDDDIVIESGTINITSIDDAIRGKDSVTIINGNITINAKGDGIKSTNEEEGYILIQNGTFNITSKNDGIESINVEIDNGTFVIKSGGGNPGNVAKTGLNTIKSTSEESSKGIKADNNILIKNCNITIDSNDDGIHSNNIIQIDSGTINISSGDDGIHADGQIIINEGTFDITASEGIEATYVKINDGTINISASDDGINAGNKSNEYTTQIEINGGNITIKMGAGDTDGIDSNGNIYINGGTINITGNSPFDYDGEAKYNGGTIIVNGETTNTITNQFMGGGNRMQRGNMNDMPGGGNMNGRGR